MRNATESPWGIALCGESRSIDHLITFDVVNLGDVSIFPTKRVLIVHLWSVGKVVHKFVGGSELESLQGVKVVLGTDTTVETLRFEVGVDFGEVVGTESGVNVVLIDYDEGTFNDVLCVWVADLEMNWSSWSSKDCWECSCQSGELDEVGDHVELKDRGC